MFLQQGIFLRTGGKKIKEAWSTLQFLTRNCTHAHGWLRDLSTHVLQLTETMLHCSLDTCAGATFFPHVPRTFLRDRTSFIRTVLPHTAVGLIRPVLPVLVKVDKPDTPMLAQRTESCLAMPTDRCPRHADVDPSARPGIRSAIPHVALESHPHRPVLRGCGRSMDITMARSRRRSIPAGGPGRRVPALAHVGCAVPVRSPAEDTDGWTDHCGVADAVVGGYVRTSGMGGSSIGCWPVAVRATCGRGGRVDRTRRWRGNGDRGARVAGRLWPRAVSP